MTHLEHTFDTYQKCENPYSRKLVFLLSKALRVSVVSRGECREPVCVGVPTYFEAGLAGLLFFEAKY